MTSSEPERQAAGRRAAVGAPSRRREHAARDIDKVVRGKQAEIRLVLTARACRGMCFSRTCLARPRPVSPERWRRASRARRRPGSSARRTLQPSDVTGLSVYNQREREFEFRPGPIFANAFSSTRSTARSETQSALLEAMARRRTVTARPASYRILSSSWPPRNRSSSGHIPLAEAQRPLLPQDRARLSESDDELQIVRDQRHGHPLGDLGAGRLLEEVEPPHHASEAVYVYELLYSGG